MSFRENLIALRKQASPSAKAFAQSIRLPYMTYRNYENGVWPSEENLIKIAAALHVSIDELLGYEGKVTDWIEAKLKPALETTQFTVDGLDKDGKLRFSYHDAVSKDTDEAISHRISMTMEESRALYGKAEREATPDHQKRLSELLAKELYERFLLVFLHDE